MTEILTAQEVADLLDCKPSTIEAKARSHELPGIKIGSSWRFPRAALMEALNRKAMDNQVKREPMPLAVTKKKTGRTPPALPSLT